jgi:sterol desaturase/sphingolipid hydroxylase (fatty acid hydroxylase superfamily)
MFRIWDRMLGTELPNYEAVFKERGAALREPQKAP